LEDHKLHIIDALFKVNRDPTHQQYHLHHLQSRKKYEAGAVAFSSTQADGSQSDLGLQRVYVALEYPYCTPANPSFAVLGFYDRLRRDVRALEALFSHQLILTSEYSFL
jgi:hypothetical protein